MTYTVELLSLDFVTDSSFFSSHYHESLINPEVAWGVKSFVKLQTSVYSFEHTGTKDLLFTEYIIQELRPNVESHKLEK